MVSAATTIGEYYSNGKKSLGKIIYQGVTTKIVSLGLQCTKCSCSCNCFFSKVHPACHSIVNGIKPGSDSRKTDKHAVDCSKAVCWGVK